LEEIPAVLVAVLVVRVSPAQSQDRLSTTLAAAVGLEQPAGLAARLAQVARAVEETAASAGLARRQELKILAEAAADAKRLKPPAAAAAA
jgi:hypothetical protein